MCIDNIPPEVRAAARHSMRGVRLRHAPPLVGYSTFEEFVQVRGLFVIIVYFFFFDF